MQRQLRGRMRLPGERVRQAVRFERRKKGHLTCSEQTARYWYLPLLMTFRFEHAYRPRLALLALSSKSKTTSAVAQRMTPNPPATMRYTSRDRIGLRNERLKDMAIIATEARKLAAAMAKSISVGMRFVLAGHVMGSSPLRRSKEILPR